MKTIVFLTVLISIISFGKSFVGGMNNTIGGIQNHNKKIEKFYAENNLHNN